MLVAALGQGNSRLMPFAVFAFVVVAIGMISFGRFRCPKCHTVLSAVNLPQEGVLSFPRYCPSCGCDFEAIDAGDIHI